MVIERLEKALECWAKEHESALRALMREAEVEMSARCDRPAWKRLAEVLDGEPSKEPREAGISSGKGPRETFDRVQRVANKLHNGFKEAQPATLGMTLEKARNELQRLERAASFEEYAKQTSRSATRIRDAAHTKQARHALLIDAGFEVALPALLELGGLLAEARAEHRIVQERARRRAEVRRVIEDSSRKLAERAWSLWRDEGMPAALEGALSEVRATAQHAVAALEAERNSIRAALASMRAALDELVVLGQVQR